MYNRILVPLDGSPLAEAALSHAEGLAQQFGSEVVLLRVVVSPYAIVAPDLVLAGYDSNHQQYVDQADQYLKGVVGKLAARNEMCIRDRAWALRGAAGRERRILTSLYLTPEGLERTNLRLQAKLAEIQKHEIRFEEEMTDDAEILLVAFGTMGRICKSSMRAARRAGLKVGLFRPISLWPFPEKRLNELAGGVKRILVVEMNAGQMLLDVRAAVAGKAPVHFYGRMGGIVPLPDEISEQIDKLASLSPNETSGNGYYKSGNGFGQPALERVVMEASHERN